MNAPVMIRDDLLTSLERHGVIVPNQSSVLEYVVQFADLADVLPDVCERVRAEFGPDVELSLEVYRDREIADEYLTLYVRLTNYRADTMDRIEHVSESLEARTTPGSGYLLITTDFRSPARGENAV